MKAKIDIKMFRSFGLILLFGISLSALFAQELEVSVEKAPRKSVKNTFESVWIIDNQTVMVPIKGTLEMDISHRFGVIRPVDAIQDLWGLFAPSNIRLGMSYAPINNLNLGIGLTKDHMLADVSAKYAILKQTQDSWAIPVSVTYYGNMSYDARRDPDGSLYKNETDRLKFFNQLIIARKITDKFSVQVAPSLSHQNFVQGYLRKDSVQLEDGTKKVVETKAALMEFDHFAISFSGRYKLTSGMAFIVNYDQPITKHLTNNPNPNFSFGLEFGTSGHSFQIFAGNYSLLSPQRNNLENHHNPFGYTNASGTKVDGGQFLIGFNITRLWNL
jgi:hypothetical protein